MKKHRLFTTAGLLSLFLLFSLFFFKTDAQAGTKRTTPLDVTIYKSGSVSGGTEKWFWNADKKTLDLDGVDFEDGIILPESGCTINVTGVNNVFGFSNAIEHKHASYDDNSLGTLTITGTGTLNLKSNYTAIDYKGNVVIKDIDLSINAYDGFEEVFKITFENAYVNATKDGYQVDYQSPLIGVDCNAGAWDGFSDVTKSLSLSACYVSTGGAVIKHNANNIYIGYSLGHPATKIEIKRGTPPSRVAKVDASSIKFAKDYKKLGITWKVPKYSDGTFTVWRSVKKDSGYKKIAKVSVPYYKDKKLNFQQTYYYKIRAYTKGRSNSHSVSDYKKIVTGLAKVKEFYYVPGKLTWKKGYGAQGYEIYRAKSLKGKYKRIKTITKGSTVSYKTSTSKYFFKIRAYRKKGSRKYYSPFVYAEDDFTNSGD